MLKKIIFAMSLMILSAYAGDSFLNSCQKKWVENANAIKSFRSDMVQIFNVGKTTTEQIAKFQFLDSDAFYSKMTLNSHLGEMTYVCRGDSSYMKIGASGWTAQKSPCAENPMKKKLSDLKKQKFTFVKNLNNKRVYKDNDGRKYIIETQTCRILQMDDFLENNTAQVTIEYEKVNGVDIPVKTVIEVPEKNVKSILEYKNVIVNKGVVKSFFIVK